MTERATVIVHLPSDIAGGDVTGYLKGLGYDVRKNGADAWSVREPYRNGPMIDTKTVAAPWLRETAFDLVMLPQDALAPHIAKAELDADSKRSRAKADAGDFGSFLYSLQMKLTLARDSEMPTTVREIYEALRKVGDPDTGVLHFPDISVHLVRYNDALHTRIRFPAFNLRLDQDPQLLDDIKNGRVDQNHLYFQAAAAFVESALVPGTFLAPLMACQSPRVWSFPATRVSGAIVFSLGKLIAGVSPIPSEPLYVLPRSSQHRLPERAPEPPPQAWAAATDWWAMKLNDFLGKVTNPCLYADRTGRYDPYEHQSWMMNASELFQRVSSTLLSWHDANAARVLTFAALDMLEKTWVDRGLFDLCSPKLAAQALVKLETSGMPEDVRAVLLPGARAAVVALETVGRGFYIAEHRKTETVDLRDAHGAVTPMSRDRAVSRLLVERRNGTHGFSNRLDDERDRVLAHHDGTLPVELVYLPFLYLLGVLNEPEALRERILRSARRR